MSPELFVALGIAFIVSAPAIIGITIIETREIYKEWKQQ